MEEAESNMTVRLRWGGGGRHGGLRTCALPSRPTPQAFRAGSYPVDSFIMDYDCE